MTAKEREDRLTVLAEAAFAQASRVVVQRAIQTGTPVIIWKDGRIQEVPPTEIVLPEILATKPLGNA